MTVEDIPFKTHDRIFADDAARLEPASLPEERGNERLALLLPDTLPIEHSVGDGERVALRAALVDLLHALQLPDRAASLVQLDGLLQRLADEPGGEAALVGETGIPADASLVDDFDAYFQVSRITSPQPAMALVRGLVQTARSVVSLFIRAPHLPETRVQQQIAGFVTYTHILARAYDLGELS